MEFLDENAAQLLLCAKLSPVLESGSCGLCACLPPSETVIIQAFSETVQP